MPSATASDAVHDASNYRSGHRFSAVGIAGIVAAHVAVFGLLASLEVIPLPAPVTTLMVQMLPAAPPPPAEVTPPRPQPVERKPQVRPTPQPTPRPQVLAAPVHAPTAAAEVPVEREAPPPPPVAAPPAPAVVTQARYDANYLQNPPPAYPPLSRRMGEEGKVVLRVYVEPDGRPSQVEVKNSSNSSRLDQAALDAVWRWRFVPAKRGEEAVGAWVLVPIVFNLKV